MRMSLGVEQKERRNIRGQSYEGEKAVKGEKNGEEGK